MIASQARRMSRPAGLTSLEFSVIRQNRSVQTLRIVFAGSPVAAVPSLRALAAGPHELRAVITREDSPHGRKRLLTPTPVAIAAEELGLPLIRANRLAAVSDDVIALEADLGVVVAYGGLIREPLLSAPRLGWINLHFSLLPRWRGAAPVQHAIMAGDRETGAAVFRLVDELDAGPVFAELRRPIGRHESAGHLLGELANSGADLLVDVVNALADGTAQAVEQRGEVTLAPKPTLADARIEWAEPAERVLNRIRGVTPEPGAFTEVDAVRVKVLAAAADHDGGGLAPGSFELRGGRLLAGTGTTPVELLTVQPAGKRAMSGVDWWRGRR
jgi:methionyl-tRNA formyltransferase